MQKILRIGIAAVVMAALLPCICLAAPDDDSSSSVSKPTSSMIRSEKLIQELAKQTDAAKTQKQFLKLVQPRLQYATIRSLTGRSDKWLAFVDVYQLYKNGKADGYRIGQATVQYGVYGLPPSAVSVTLNVGTYSSTIDESARSVYIFDNAKLNKDAVKGEVNIQLANSNTDISISLTQNMPESIVGPEEVLKVMAPYYVEFVNQQISDNGAITIYPIDHAFLRLRSHVVNTNTLEMNYTWELFLVHDSVYPTTATYIRYNVPTESASVTMRDITIQPQ